MKKLLAILFVVFMFLGCVVDYEEPEANIQIASWNMTIIAPPSEYWQINISVENTGAVDIDSFDIYMDITCTDLTIYSIRVNSLIYSTIRDTGIIVEVGTTYYGRTYAYIDNKTISNIVITSYSVEANY